MTDIYFPDFSFRDVIRPEGRRFKYILSSLINFAKFREDQLAVFEQFTHKTVRNNFRLKENILRSN